MSEVKAPVYWPSFFFHPTLPEQKVENEEAALALVAQDKRWRDSPYPARPKPIEPPILGRNATLDARLIADFQNQLAEQTRRINQLTTDIGELKELVDSLSTPDEKKTAKVK